MRPGPVVAFVSVAAMVALAAPAARAAGPTPEDKAKARDHYNKGLVHYDLKEYPEALAEFKNAYRYVQDPAFLFNIAQCHRRLGQNAEALDFYRNFLRRSPAAPNRAEVQRRIEEIEREQPSATAPAPRAPGASAARAPAATAPPPVTP